MSKASWEYAYPEEKEAEEGSNGDGHSAVLADSTIIVFCFHLCYSRIAGPFRFQRAKQEEMDGGDGGDCFLTLTAWKWIGAGVGEKRKPMNE